ncbi:helix-turn-helix transcriptional regulator [Bacillus sp. 03113]|uniref:helix-turn-helix transcriptional regulator n=1 Tax=Bacillus sp. 03113 TaxID=2578211 RepID=UPI001142BFA8
MADLQMGRSRLSYLLRRINMSQSEFARRLGVSDSYVSRIISGEKKLSYYRAKLSADILRCSMEDLYEWEYK